MMKEIGVKTNKKFEIIDITNEVNKFVEKSNLKEGLINIYTLHTTAAIIINENDDPNICLDILDALSGLIPEGKWRHDKIDNNAASHIKAAILGASETIPIKDGKLSLGRWQAIMLIELDGPRDRKVIFTFVD